jgi:hypothetical protein
MSHPPTEEFPTIDPLDPPTREMRIAPSMDEQIAKLTDIVEKAITSLAALEARVQRLESHMFQMEDQK